MNRLHDEEEDGNKEEEKKQRSGNALKRSEDICRYDELRLTIKVLGQSWRPIKARFIFTDNQIFYRPHIIPMYNTMEYK